MGVFSPSATCSPPRAHTCRHCAPETWAGMGAPLRSVLGGDGAGTEGGRVRKRSPLPAPEANTPMPEPSDALGVLGFLWGPPNCPIATDPGPVALPAHTALLPWGPFLPCAACSPPSWPLSLPPPPQCPLFQPTVGSFMAVPFAQGPGVKEAALLPPSRSAFLPLPR